MNVVLRSLLCPHAFLVQLIETVNLGVSLLFKKSLLRVSQKLVFRIVCVRVCSLLSLLLLRPPLGADAGVQRWWLLKFAARIRGRCSACLANRSQDITHLLHVDTRAVALRGVYHLGRHLWIHNRYSHSSQAHVGIRRPLWLSGLLLQNLSDRRAGALRATCSCRRVQAGSGKRGARSLRLCSHHVSLRFETDRASAWVVLNHIDVEAVVYGLAWMMTARNTCT